MDRFQYERSSHRRQRGYGAVLAGWLFFTGMFEKLPITSLDVWIKRKQVSISVYYFPNQMRKFSGVRHRRKVGFEIGERVCRSVDPFNDSSVSAGQTDIAGSAG
jgi:hypothetical protein